MKLYDHSLKIPFLAVFHLSLIIRGETPGGIGVKQPPDDEKLVICRSILLAAGMFVGQF